MLRRTAAAPTFPTQINVGFIVLLNNQSRSREARPRWVKRRGELLFFVALGAQRTTSLCSEGAREASFFFVTRFFFVFFFVALGAQRTTSLCSEGAREASFLFFFLFFLLTVRKKFLRSYPPTYICIGGGTGGRGRGGDYGWLDLERSFYKSNSIL